VCCREVTSGKASKIQFGKAGDCIQLRVASKVTKQVWQGTTISILVVGVQQAQLARSNDKAGVGQEVTSGSLCGLSRTEMSPGNKIWLEVVVRSVGFRSLVTGMGQSTRKLGRKPSRNQFLGSSFRLGLSDAEW
jgi:hypothetical protein